MASTWISFSEVVRRARIGGNRVSRRTILRQARRVNAARLARNELPILRPRRGRGGGFEVWVEALQAEAARQSDESEERTDLIDWRLRGVERVQRNHTRQLKEHTETLGDHERRQRVQEKRSEALGRIVQGLKDLVEADSG